MIALVCSLQGKGGTHLSGLVRYGVLSRRENQSRVEHSRGAVFGYRRWRLLVEKVLLLAVMLKMRFCRFLVMLHCM
jgi:hypothetical protein